jgi:hypothetical protein
MKSTQPTKPKKGLKEWIKGQYISNLIKIIINSIILALLIYWIEGLLLNDEPIFVISFSPVFITMVTLMVVNDVISDSRIAFLQGKWELKPEETPSQPGKIISPWRRFGPEAAILSCIAALLVTFLLYALYLVKNPLPFLIGPILSIVISFTVTLFISSLILKHHLFSDLSSFAAALASSEQASTGSFKHYFFWEHTLPWSIILAVLNFEINLKGYTEKLELYGIITVNDLLLSIFVTALVVLAWMYLSAQNQVRPDVRLGRVTQGRQISRILAIILVLGIPFVMSIIFYFYVFIARIPDFSVIDAIIVIIIVAILSVIIGRSIGVSRGKIKEFSLLKTG